MRKSHEPDKSKPENTGSQMGRYIAGALIALALDYATVWLALGAGAHAWLARALGLLIGITTTYFFNRRFTFSSTGSASLGEWSRYASMQLIGSALNFAVSTFGIYLGDRSAWQLALAVGAGAVAGFSYNFFAARRLLHAPKD
ncbi:MAG: GtrA family protein [Casimicrobium sp.]